MIHAFIPGEYGKKFINKLTVESLYVINNFTVRHYNTDEKFRVVRNDVNLIFSTEIIKVKDIEEDNCVRKIQTFDFFDHDELKKTYYKCNVYLTSIKFQICKRNYLRHAIICPT